MNTNIWQELPKGFTVLAPMEGVTDVAFRQVVARAGRPDLFYTEFTNVSSFASEKGRTNALERLEVAPTDAPIIAQIWGKEPAHFAELSRALAALGFSGVDLNFGCPDKHVNKAGGGAAMILTPDLAVECLKNVMNATDLPVSVKTRLGWSAAQEYQDWLPVLLREHPAALTVHLRTKKEMSKVAAHYELIPDVVRLRDEISPLTKLVINGDIKDLAQIHEMKTKYPGVDGYMIGRGVFANPYCFTDYTPTQEDLMGLLKLHLDLYEKQMKKYAAAHANDRKVIRKAQGRLVVATPTMSYEPLKHYFKIYINNFPGAADLRAQLMETHSVREAREVIARMSL